MPDSVKWTPDGTYLVVGAEGEVLLEEDEEGEVIGEIADPEGMVSAHPGT